MKKIIAAFILIICVLGCCQPPQVAADSGITVLANTAEMDFPIQLSFGLSAESDTGITDIRLHYRVLRSLEHARVTSEVDIDFTPATTVSETWVWDMRKTGGLPPGSGVVYWWTITDYAGRILETARVEISIEDNRYDWQSLSEDKVTIYWYYGDETFAQEIMDTAQDALSRLALDTGAELEKAAKLYIYANSTDLQGSMIYPQEWTGGVAFTEYGIIAIGISPGTMDWGKRAIAHELTHLVIHQVTFNPYGDLPTWLDEGLAMKAEGELGIEFASILDTAIETGDLTSVQSLASPFSAYSDESYLAYAESYSIVAYLIDTYGQEKMFELLNTFRQGSGYDAALEEVYGFDMDGLNGLWRLHLQADIVAVEPATSETSPALILVLVVIGAGLLVVVVMIVLRRTDRPQ